MPPIPRPVNTLHIDRSYTPLARVAIAIPRVITARQPSRVRRRPSLSGTPPRSIEPIPMPSSSMERTTPNTARSMPQSRAMPGEAKLIDSTSNPSRAFRPTVMATTAIWIPLIGFLAMTSRGSKFTSAAVHRQRGQSIEQCQQLLTSLVADLRGDSRLVDGLQFGGALQLRAAARRQAERVGAAVGVGSPAPHQAALFQVGDGGNEIRLLNAEGGRDARLAGSRVSVDHQQDGKLT